MNKRLLAAVVVVTSAVLTGCSERVENREQLTSRIKYSKEKLLEGVAEEQREWDENHPVTFEKVGTLSFGMTLQQVRSILGPEQEETSRLTLSDGTVGDCYCWRNKKGDGVLTAQFVNGRLRRYDSSSPHRFDVEKYHKEQIQDAEKKLKALDKKEEAERARAAKEKEAKEKEAKEEPVKYEVLSKGTALTCVLVDEGTSRGDAQKLARYLVSQGHSWVQVWDSRASHSRFIEADESQPVSDIERHLVAEADNH